jgi:hypothetical protein
LPRPNDREADALAKRHREEAESVAAAARDTSDLAATLKQFADQRAQAAADATRRKEAAEQQYAELERELNITKFVAGKERDVAAEPAVAEPAVAEPAVAEPAAAVGLDLRGTAEQQDQPAEEEQAPPVEASEEPPTAEEDEQPVEAKEEGYGDEVESEAATPGEPEQASQQASQVVAEAVEGTTNAGKASTESTTVRKGRTSKSSRSGSTSGGKRTSRSKDKK